MRSTCIIYIYHGVREYNIIMIMHDKKIHITLIATGYVEKMCIISSDQNIKYKLLKNYLKRTPKASYSIVIKYRKQIAKVVQSSTAGLK